MQIRTKIKLIGVSLILIAGIIYPFIFWLGRFAESEHQKEDTATQIVKVLFEMDTLVNEYVPNPSRRSANQWRDKHSELENRLSTKIFENIPEEQELVDKMREKSFLLKSSFEEVAIINERRIGAEDINFVRNRLISQLSESGNRIVETALLLTERLRVREVKIQTIVNGVGIVIVIIALLIGYFGSRVLVKNMLSPLNELSNFAKKISRGRFDSTLSPALLRRDDEFGQLGETFRDMAKSLENLDKAKTEFISIAAHQLRTPVSALKWLAESLEAEELTEKQKQYLEDLSVSIGRLVKLVEDLLSISKFGLGQTDAREIDAASTIRQIISDINKYASLMGHSIELDIEKEPLTMVTDTKILYNVLQNLLTNAVDYSPRNTKVTVRVEKPGNHIKVSVSNEGTLLKEDRGNIFQKFFRGSEAKKVKPDGTGLGLYIVKSLVEGSGGEVGFFSSDKEGTTFWFTLPLKYNNKNNHKHE